MKLKGCLLIAILFCISCDKDDDSDSPTNFYIGAQTSASVSNLEGIWSIYDVGFNGQIVNVPSNYEACGRDYFRFASTGIYSEYLFQSSNCDFEVSNNNWELNNGIITFSNQFNQVDDWVITELSTNALIFKARFDVDEDGRLDVLTFYAQRYEPIDIDMVSDTFARNNAGDYQNLISYVWEPYQGVEAFVGYEIYRSAGADCTKDNAVLIATITDANTTEFTDLSPPIEERLCYYLKTVIQSRVLGESFLETLDTFTLEANAVNLFNPTVVNNTINLSWEESDMPYFSHYEISVSNFDANSTGYGKQNIVISEISDKSNLSFADDNPPYFENPVYNMIVYDIFGNKSFSNPDGYTTSWEVQYQRDELLGIHRIFSYAIDTEEPVIYFYGYETGESNSIKIHRYNYVTNTTEAISALSPSTSTSLSIEVVNSIYGKELVLAQGSELEIYDARTLEYKYSLEPLEVSSLNYFRFTSSGFLVCTDGDNVHTYTRNDSNLTLIDRKPHFPNHQASYNYSIFEIENNQLLVGHINEPNSILYSLDSNGNLSNQEPVAFPILENGNRKSQYNAQDNYLINFEERKLYSTLNFTLLESYNQPLFASGFSNDGKVIYGSNNDPDWSINENSLHTKEVVIFDRVTQQTAMATTIGYPHVIFESYNGDVISISTGLKKRI